MLKVILIAFFITGCICSEYNEEACETYKHQSLVINLPSFPEFYEVSNNENLHGFDVIRDQDDIEFQVTGDQNKVLSFKTVKYGTMTLSGLRFTINEDGISFTITFDLNVKYPKVMTIHSEVFGAPVAGEHQEHAKTHALNLEPLTGEDIENLKGQSDKKTRFVWLSVQWILDLITDARPPRFISSDSESEAAIYKYISPPTLISADTLNKLSDLKDEMESS